MQATIDPTVDILVIKQETAGRQAMAVPMPIIPPRNTRMRRVVDRARQLAGDGGPLLLRGEIGVGKRVLAGLIHQWGPQLQGSCVLVQAAVGNAATSPQEIAARLGGAGSRGTLVFDEIGEFALEQQDEILALIGSHGGAGETADGARGGVKIVATSSRDLAAAAKRREFREALLSLLMDETLYLPPLRERPEDIAGLSEQMLEHFGAWYHRPGLSLEPEAKLALARHTWPENIHELRNVIEHAVLTAKRSEIGESELRLRAAADPACNRAGKFLSLDALERQHILRVIRASATLEEAARILQVDITTLWRKRHRYGI